MAQDGAAAAAAAAEVPAQNHESVITMFPHLDLEATLREFRHMSPDALAEYIIENEGKIPKKRRGQKRQHESPPPESDNESVGSADLSDYEDVDGQEDLMVSVMVAELLYHLKRELQWAKTPQAQDDPAPIRYWLRITFPGAKATFIDKIMRQFNNRVVACAIACFLVENKFGFRLQKYAMELPRSFWRDVAAAMKNKRRPTEPELKLAKSLQPKEASKFIDLMKAMKTKFPKLFDGDQLSQDARHLKAEKDETVKDEDKMDCIVCYETVPVATMLSCNAPTAGRTPSPDPDVPTSSAAAIASANTESVHTFCRSCLRRHAKAACEDRPMAPGGVGLTCLEHGCTNPVLFSEIRHLLPKDVRKRLDERVQEENLGLAGFNNLERCPKCNFAMVMDVPKEVDKVFRCQNAECEYQFCRFCEQPWDEDHFGVSCDQLDKNSKENKEQRELERQLNEIVVRKCPKCGLTFLKESGCNKMTCRCGMKQCYVCKESPIDYTHFCPHVRDPNAKQKKCTECNKPCLLWEDASKKDEAKIKEVLNGREEPLKDIPTASAASTSLQHRHNLDPMLRVQELRQRMEDMQRRHIELAGAGAWNNWHLHDFAEPFQLPEQYVVAEQVRRRVPPVPMAPPPVPVVDNPANPPIVAFHFQPPAAPPQAAAAQPAAAGAQQPAFAYRAGIHQGAAEALHRAHAAPFRFEEAFPRARRRPDWANRRENPLYLQEQRERVQQQMQRQDPLDIPLPGEHVAAAAAPALPPAPVFALPPDLRRFELDVDAVDDDILFLGAEEIDNVFGALQENADAAAAPRP